MEGSKDIGERGAVKGNKTGSLNDCVEDILAPSPALTGCDLSRRIHLCPKVLEGSLMQIALSL